MARLSSCQLIALSTTLLLLLLAADVSSNLHGNPANDIVNIINNNRTSQRLPQLNDNPGLGCIALQIIEQCKSNCTTNNTLNCKPSEDDFTEIFAPNCGVELPTFGTITARVVGCRHRYLKPSVAFLETLFREKRALSILRNRSNSEVGVGFFRAHKKKGPYFWCVLFGNGKGNSTFALEDLGQGIEQRKGGCYSGGNGNRCGGAGSRSGGLFGNKVWGVVVLCLCWLFKDWHLFYFW